MTRVTALEMATLGPPWPEWMGLQHLDPDLSLVVVAERVVSNDCNDGITSEQLSLLLSDILGTQGTARAWMNSDRLYRAKLLNDLGEQAVLGFSPVGRVSICADMRMRSQTILMDAHPSRELLLQSPQGLLAVLFTGPQLAGTGLSSDLLTFSGWNSDRIGLFPLPGREIEMWRYPTYEEVLDTHQVMVFGAGEHGSDCIFSSRTIGRDALADMVWESIHRLGWRASSVRHIEGPAYEQLYQESLREERHPGHSKIFLDLGSEPSEDSSGTL